MCMWACALFSPWERDLIIFDVNYGLYLTLTFASDGRSNSQSRSNLLKSPLLTCIFANICFSCASSDSCRSDHSANCIGFSGSLDSLRLDPHGQPCFLAQAPALAPLNLNKCLQLVNKYFLGPTPLTLALHFGHLPVCITAIFYPLRLFSWMLIDYHWQ